MLYCIGKSQGQREVIDCPSNPIENSRPSLHFYPSPPNQNFLKEKYTYRNISSRSCTVVHTRQNISCFDLACRADAQYSSLDLG